MTAADSDKEEKETAADELPEGADSSENQVDAAARLSKSDKKKVNKARKKQARSDAKLKKKVEQGDVPQQQLVYRRPRIRLLTPPRTTSDQWATLDALEAMSRLRVCVVG